MLYSLQHLVIISTLLAVLSQLSFAQGTVPSVRQKSLYHAISAEFATEREQYDKALEHYLTLLDDQQSIYIAERITRLSLHNGRFSDMLRGAIAWQQQAPKNSVSNFFLSIALAYEHHPQLAFEAMRRAHQYQHKTDFTRLSHLLEASDNQQWYIDQLLNISEQQPLNYDMQLALAILYFQTQQPQLSLNHLALATASQANNIALYTYAARLYVSLEQPQLALAMYQRITENKPYHHELRLKYAQFASQYAPHIASEQFEILRLQMPNNAFILLKLGLIYLETQELKKAQSIFMTLLDNEQQTTFAHYYLGEIAKQQQQWDKALTHFSQINAHDSPFRTKEKMAHIYLQQKRFNKAHSIIDAQLEEQPKHEDAERFHLLKALAYQQQGHGNKAYQHLSQQLKQSPDSIDIRYNRAMLAQQQNDLLQMEADLRYILSLRPDSTEALNALGYTLASQTDRLDEAFQLIQQALILSPQDPAILDSMGWVLYRMGRWQEALQYLQQAMLKLPDAEVAAHLTEVLWMLGQKDDAKIVLLEALNITPNHNNLNEIIKRLDIPL